MVKILFVCLGNICRSPAAEGIMKSIVTKNNMDDDVFIDSAGTSAYHVGEKADSRMRRIAKSRGYNLLSRSRKLVSNDLNEFDYILGMDKSNYDNIKYLDKNDIFSDKIKMITDFSENYIYQDVPDPYYGGDEGFNNVIDILEDSCKGFLNYLIDKFNLR